MMTDQLEKELRGAFARHAPDQGTPEAVRTRLVQRDYHPRTANRGLVAGLATAAVAAGIAIPLAVAGTQAPAAGATIRMGSHTFRMPTGYRLTAATSAPCHPFAVYIDPGGDKTSTGKKATPLGGMRAAASAAGGCLVFGLAPAYVPQPGAPDPEAYTSHPVRVGKYHGYVFHMREYIPKEGISEKAVRHGITPGWHHATNLWVQLPDGNGQLRDLVVGAAGLSDQALINLVANGLSS